MSDPFEQLLQWIRNRYLPENRPSITLSYAQSLDGSIAAEKNAQLFLSSPASRQMTHHLRAEHDSILVGIGTILADDPQLTVRLAEGPDPQPIILDSHLKTPQDSKVFENKKKPWIITGQGASQNRRNILEAAGAAIYTLPLNGNNGIDLGTFVSFLASMGSHMLMVEGGAHIIHSFLEEQLVDQVVLTIAPVFVNGIPSLGNPISAFQPPFPRIDRPQWQMFDSDLVLWGELKNDGP